MTTIAFIGGGNMASCIIGGMLANGFSSEQIRVSDPGEQAEPILNRPMALRPVPTTGHRRRCRYCCPGGKTPGDGAGGQ